MRSGHQSFLSPISLASSPLRRLLSKAHPMVIYTYGRRALELVVWGLTSIALVESVIAPFLPQSFFFSWDPPGLPIPVTVQCGNIHITWERSTATGPNNVAPYYLQIYTSLYLVPIIIPVGSDLAYDWQVPFPPGTLYQICMFDKNGNTGGCQATYTVIANTTTTTPTCANVTFPPILSIDAEVNNGPLSQIGWVDQCTDISVTPKNGTPPYTFTIAPALHPPYNLTSPDMRSINWTVSLSWASPFFISVVDAAGNMWANGPLHSGQGNSSACLAGNTTTISSDKVKPAVAIGSGVGGMAFGFLVGILTALLFLKRHYQKVRDSSGSTHAILNPSTPMGTSSQYIPIPFITGAGNSMASSNPPPSSKLGRSLTSTTNATEPSVISGGNGYRNEVSPGPSRTLSAASTSLGHRQGLSPGPSRSLSAASTSHGGTSQGSQVYVVHHDSQSPPVTIYHDDGTQVVELPPKYPSGIPPASDRDALSVNDSRSNDGRTDTTEPLTSIPEHGRPTVAEKPAQEAIPQSNSTA